MPLVSGTKLGPYDVVGSLGTGGMGEVYRAHDTRLDRVVGIKILPGHMADSALSRERFEREARALASLNHPNICAIYDVGHQDGIEYLVMEYVEGETLASRLLRDSIPVEQVLQYALEIADALDQAHCKGITHRDLKPANIMLTTEGHAKVLDFGLANRRSPADGASEVDQASTVGFITEQGAPMGTYAYMSPEQALGKPIDTRTDLFSFGTTLYEMATRKRPFQGKTTTAICDAILHEQPVPPRQLNGEIPEKLQETILKCLEKDPRLRYQTAAEIGADLRRMQRDGNSSPAALIHRPLPPTAKVTRWTVAGALALFLVFGIAFFLRRQHPPIAPMRFEQLTNFTDATLWPALSPDGRILAFVRRGSFVGGIVSENPAQVYVKMLPDGEPVQITNDEFAKGPISFSPEGTRIAYTIIDKGFSWDTWTIPVLGGKEQPLLKNASGLFWAPDGQLVYSEMDHGLHMRIVTSKENRTDARQIYAPEKSSGMAHRSALSPDGMWLLLAEMDETGWLPCRVVPFDGSNSGHRVGPSNGQCLNVAWSPDGRWMYMQSNSGGAHHIWRQLFPDGAPEQLTSGPTQEQGIAVASDGKSIITSMGTEESTLWVHGPDGDRQVTFQGFAQLPVFSPTENKLYFLQRSGDDPGFVTGELWVAGLAASARTPVLHGFRMSHFSISDDGEYVAFAVIDPADQSGVWIAPLEGRSPPRRLSNNREDRVFFLHNGDLVILSWDGQDRHLFRIGRDGTRHKLLEDPLLYLLDISPDDKWVIATTPLEGSESGTVVTKAFSLTGDGSRIICSICAPGGAEAHRDATVASWSRDGKSFYISYQYFPGMGNHFFTIAVPLHKNEMLPPLPAEGISTAADLLRLPGATRIEERNVFPGNDSNHYAMRRVLDKKNLFRIILP